MDENLENYLKKHGIKYELYKHLPVFTVEESKKMGLNLPGLRAKNLFLKDNLSNFYLVCMPGEKRLDMKKLKKELEIKELHFGSPEELKKELNLTPGSVSIFGMIQAEKTMLLIDSDLWNAEKTGFHPNINNETIVISHAELEKIFSLLECKKKVIAI